MKTSFKNCSYIFTLIFSIIFILIPWMKVLAYSNITPLEVKKFINTPNSSALIIDVRTPDEYKTGYIENSINIPIQILNEELISKNIDKNTKIILYCRSGIRSKKAAEILDNLGYKNVFVLGGIIDWPYEIIKKAS